MGDTSVMPTFEKIRLVTDDDGVTILTLNDIETHNALTLEMVHELTVCFEYLEHDPKTKVLILSAEGPVFSCGADKSVLQGIATGEIHPTDIRLPKLILDLPFPVISAMAGDAVGGGFALGLCADMIIISKSSRYGFTFMNMGFTPGMGTTKLAEIALNQTLAHELLYTGECVKGNTFVGHSCFNGIVDTKDVLPLAIDKARQISDKPREALFILKRCLSLSKRQLFEETATTESMMHEICFAHATIANRIDDGYVK